MFFCVACSSRIALDMLVARALKNSQPTCGTLPKTAAEVAQIVRLAAANRVPIVTRGSGTGLSGGSVPVAGGIVLCLAQMDRVLELDQRS